MESWHFHLVLVRPRCGESKSTTNHGRLLHGRNGAGDITRHCTAQHFVDGSRLFLKDDSPYKANMSRKIWDETPRNDNARRIHHRQTTNLSLPIGLRDGCQLGAHVDRKRRVNTRRQTVATNTRRSAVAVTLIPIGMVGSVLNVGVVRARWRRGFQGDLIGNIVNGHNLAIQIKTIARIEPYVLAFHHPIGEGVVVERRLRPRRRCGHGKAIVKPGDA